MNGTFPATARRSGNSLVVTIPYNVAKTYKIQDGTSLEVSVRKLDDQEEEK